MPVLSDDAGAPRQLRRAVTDDAGMPRLKEVARRAGVAPSTASRVLSETGYASAEARERVLRAAAELGYSPNRVARSLRSQRTRTIGLLLEDIANSFYAQIAKGVEQTARREGYLTVLGETEANAKREAEYLRLYEETQVEGLIVTPTGHNTSRYRALLNRGVHVVQVDVTLAGLAADSVTINNADAARDGVLHLLGHGHREIGMVVDLPELASIQERIDGYRMALRAEGIEPSDDLIAIAPHRGADAVTVIRELIARRPNITAFFTATNSAMASLVEVLLARGLRWPDDVSLVSFDDTAWMSLFPQAITTVRQPTQYMAQTAARMVLERLSGEAPDHPLNVVLRAQLESRGSVRRL